MPRSFAPLKACVYRLPFTLGTLALLAVVGMAVDPGFGTLSDTWVQRLGFAPTDLFHLRWHRAFTSLFLIVDVRSYAQAFLTIGIVVGALEWHTSTRKAAYVFWGTHLAAIVIETLFFAAPLYYWGSSFGERLFLTRDVGASAAYMGCTGAVCALLPNPWRRISTGLMIGFIAYTYVFPTPVSSHTPLRWMGNIAHTIAFTLGYVWAVRERASGNLA
jgi:hypothetical protein